MTGQSLPDPSLIVGLRVWHAREGDGYWSPEYGNIEVPLSWEFLSSGDAFLTRTVKSAGPHWILLKRRKHYTETLGVFAPKTTIAMAEDLGKATSEKRARQRDVSARGRERQEEHYRKEFYEAALRFLDFAPRYHKVAEEIARGASEQATVKWSGRVGRTKLLSLDVKVELAVKAYIRHKHTDYEKHLRKSSFGDDEFHSEMPREEYLNIKQDAHYEAEKFIVNHRRKIA